VTGQPQHHQRPRRRRGCRAWPGAQPAQASARLWGRCWPCSPSVSG